MRALYVLRRTPLGNGRVRTASIHLDVGERRPRDRGMRRRTLVRNLGTIDFR